MTRLGVFAALLTLSAMSALGRPLLFTAPITLSRIFPAFRSTIASSVCPADAPRCTPAMTISPPQITGPTWTLEYNATDSAPLLSDLAIADNNMAAMERLGVELAPLAADPLSLQASDGIVSKLADMYSRYWDSVILLSNVGTYAGCVSSVDGSDNAAKKLSSKIQTLFARLKAAYEPAALILDRCSEDLLKKFLSVDEQTKASEFSLRHSRKMANHRLSLAEENMITGLQVSGHSAWGTMYSDLSSEIVVEVKQEDGSMKKMGVAMADAFRDNPDEKLRKASWEGIREAWLTHRESCAAALNAITGWRLEIYKRRGYESFLTESLHMNRMSKKTLDALLSAIEQKVEVGRKALRVQARVLGKDSLEPWDLFAPAPVGVEGSMYTFEDGIELIANSVGDVDGAAGEFVRMMKDKEWIEASRGEKKRPGAYCTGFRKTRSPRVYLSDYNGRAQLLLTLAHELGHAFHSWQMRDLPNAQLGYPMNLAETASIFFETVVGNALLDKAKTPEERLGMLWGDAESAATFLLNIPSRFRFEEELNVKRNDGKLSVEEIDDMMVRAWERYYGDALNGTERVGVFSQSKLHFYLTGISFYNWPYSFGYLFALGVYAEYERAKDPSVFPRMYRELLRDTGRMSAEDVIEKHLGGRIDEPEFWLNAIAVAEKKVDMLDSVARELGY